jgi:hypothetical protein
VDLQWITFFLIIIAAYLLVYIVTGGALYGIAKDGAAAAGGIVTVVLAILNWVYQSGSNRLGAVDLFGCEISAICRVIAVVDFAPQSVGWAEHQGDADTAKEPVRDAKLNDKADLSRKFTSEEQYTPAYD